MGVYDPQIGVGTSGTRPALGRNYATNAATAGRVLTSQGDNLPPTWAAPAPGVLPVAQTLFVDAVNSPGVGMTGTLAAPFQTLQQAVNQAVANGWTQVEIFVAPATYAAAVAIPIALEIVTFTGWTDFLPPILGGDIVYASLPAGWANLNFINCNITAATIQTDNPAANDLNLFFERCSNAAAVTAANLVVEFRETFNAGAMTGNTALFTRWDGWSWRNHVLLNPALAPAAYFRTFLDAGHDVYAASLTANGVAIGTTTFFNVAVPWVRAGDYATVQVLDPVATDYICGVHSSSAGQVQIWLTNLSRVSTNFNEAAQVMIHHMQMQAEPAP